MCAPSPIPALLTEHEHGVGSATWRHQHRRLAQSGRIPPDPDRVRLHLPPLRAPRSCTGPACKVGTTRLSCASLCLPAIVDKLHIEAHTKT